MGTPRDAPRGWRLRARRAGRGGGRGAGGLAAAVASVAAATAASLLGTRREAGRPAGGGGGRGAAPPFPRGAARQPYCRAVCGGGGASRLSRPIAPSTASPSLPQPRHPAPPRSASATLRAGRSSLLSSREERLRSVPEIHLFRI
nr:alanine and glycine-rich protein-like [Kogia breviceps]